MSDKPLRRSHEVINLTDRSRDGDWDREVLERLFADSPVPIQIVAPNGEARRQNDAHLAFEAAFDDGARLVPRVKQGTPTLHEDKLARALDGEVVDYQFSLPTGPGSFDWFERVLAPVNGPDGSLRSVVCITVDITERKRMEEEKARLDAQFLHTQKLESLGVLAGGIAHDFNNLLVAVLGNASLLTRHLPQDSPLRKYAQGIETAARRAADVAQQMLAYAGKATFATEPVDLNHLIRETAELLRISVSRRVSLEYDLCSEVWVVRADATQLRQVIMNLLTNASEAMVDHQGTIVLRTGNVETDAGAMSRAVSGLEAPPGRYAFVEVHDQGPGMSRETLERIFDPFFTTKLTGRGLGLAAVFGIVRGHGGAIQVTSSETTGTTFRVLFPASRASESPSDVRDLAAPNLDRLPRGGVVLVVDDEPSVRRVAANMMTSLGLEPLEADDGLEALRLFGEHRARIVAVLLDMTMPHLDGRETFRRLREASRSIPVVLTSGFEVDAASRGALGQGAVFLPKPFSLSDLARALESALDAHAR